MSAEECFQRRWVRRGRAACRDGAEELKKFLGGARGEAVGGVADDIGVHVVGEMKTDGAAAWTGPLRIVVGNYGNACSVGEAHGNGGGAASGVWRASERCGFWCRRKGPGEQRAFGMYGAVARIRSTKMHCRLLVADLCRGPGLFRHWAEALSHSSDKLRWLTSFVLVFASPAG